MTKNTKNISIKHKIWIENSNGEGLLGDGMWELLKLIDEKESLKGAINKIGWGYRSTWSKLKELEERLNFPVIEKKRGGKGGGGQTALTAEGKAFVDFYMKVHLHIDAEISKHLSKFEEEYKKKF